MRVRRFVALCLAAKRLKLWQSVVMCVCITAGTLLIGSTQAYGSVTTNTDPFWVGYAMQTDQLGQSSDLVTGEFVVPVIDCSKSAANTNFAEWVGFGGLAGTPNPGILVQIGVNISCVTGSQFNLPFYEVVGGKNPADNLPEEPLNVGSSGAQILGGDSVDVAVRLALSNNGEQMPMVILQDKNNQIITTGNIGIDIYEPVGQTADCMMERIPVPGTNKPFPMPHLVIGPSYAYCAVQTFYNGGKEWSGDAIAGKACCGFSPTHPPLSAFIATLDKSKSTYLVPVRVKTAGNDRYLLSTDKL